MLLTIAVVSLLCVVPVHSGTKHEGSNCTLPNGNAGVCRKLSQCVPARCGRPYDVPVTRCSMHGVHEIVCCDRIRPSEKACESFKNGNIHHLIFRGETTTDAEFPHMVALGFIREARKRTIEWNCAGSLISNSFVLTAAHCVTDTEKGTLKKVKLGSINLRSRRETNTQEINVLKIFVANNYIPPSKANDLALIKLVKKVNFVPNMYNIYPACLSTKEFVSNETFTVTGYGHSDSAGITTATILRKANLMVWNRSECEAHFRGAKIQLPTGLTSSMTCAGNGTGDPCAGDSGGPIQMINKTELPHIYGVTSFGNDPCGGSKPSVYTNVLQYLDWIECIVWPDEDYNL